METDVNHQKSILQACLPKGHPRSLGQAGDKLVSAISIILLGAAFVIVSCLAVALCALALKGLSITLRTIGF